MGKYLTGNTYDWCTIYLGICQSGYQVGSARTTGGKHYAYLARCTRKTLCRMNTTLFVANEYVFQLIVIIIQCIIYGHDSTAGISEYGFYILSNQSFQYCLRTTDCGCRSIVFGYLFFLYFKSFHKLTILFLNDI